jgi:hypothetical protein
VRKFCALYKFHKERRRSPRGYFECGDTTHFITDCPKRKKLDSSNKYDYSKERQEEVPLRGQEEEEKEEEEEEVLEDDVLSVCCPQRP